MTLNQSPTDPAFVQNPYPVYARARAAAPLQFWEDYGMMAAFSHEAVQTLLKDRRFGREIPAELARPHPSHLAPFYAIDDHSMLELDGDTHKRLRGLVLRAFTSRRIAALGPEIAALSHQLIDAFPTGDFDLLAHTDAKGEKITGPSVYSEMVWSARQLRAQAGLKPIDWAVMRNRVGTQRMVNKEKMERAVKMLAKRVGFRIVPGFSERVIFRELFPRGLTLLDLKDIGVKQLNISNVAARQELRDMMKELKLPGVEVNF